MHTYIFDEKNRKVVKVIPGVKIKSNLSKRRYTIIKAKNLTQAKNIRARRMSKIKEIKEVFKSGYARAMFNIPPKKKKR